VHNAQVCYFNNVWLMFLVLEENFSFQTTVGPPHRPGPSHFSLRFFTPSTPLPAPGSSGVRGRNFQSPRSKPDLSSLPFFRAPPTRVGPLSFRICYHHPPYNTELAREKTFRAPDQNLISPACPSSVPSPPVLAHLHSESVVIVLPTAMSSREHKTPFPNPVTDWQTKWINIYDD